MASDANANRAISVSSTGEASRPAERSRRELKKAEKQAKLTSNQAALEAIRLEKNRLRNVRIKFWTPTIIIGLFVLVSTFTSSLVQPDNSVSLIWLIPFAFLLLAIAVGFRDRKSDQPLKRIILSLIVALILFVGFLAITTISFLAFAATDIFAYFVGNSTMGQPGVANAFGGWLGGIGVVGPPLKVIVLILGALINFALVIVMPALLVSLIVQEIAYEYDPSTKNVLVLTLLALVAFLFPIGLSIVGNLGF